MEIAAASPALRVSAQSVRTLTPARLIIGMTLLALALRLTNLGGRVLWLDEAFSAWFANQSFHYLWTVVPTYEAHPPFYYSLLKTWCSIFGDGIVALRLPSALLGTLTVPVIMAAVLEQERQRPSGQLLLRLGLVGFLAGCSPMLLFIGQEARPYPLLAFSYAVAILALLRLMRDFSEGGSGPWRSWLLFAAAAEVTAWSHSLGILYVACLALALLPAWVKGMHRERLVRGTLTACSTAALYVPCLLMIAARAGDWGSNWLVWRPRMLLELVSLYSLPFEIMTVATTLGAFGMLLLLKRGLDSAVQRKGWTDDRALTLLWLGPPLLAALISWLVVPVFLARTLTGTLVPAFLAIGSGVAASRGPAERRFLVLAIALALLPLAPKLALREPAERWDLASTFLARHVLPRDEVWLYPSDSALPLSRAGSIPGTVRAIPEPFPTLGFDGPIRAGWPATVSVTPGQAAQFANDPALRTVPVIWLLTRQSDTFDPDSDVPNALTKVRRAGPPKSWGYITVQPFYLRGAKPTSAATAVQ